MRNYRELEVWNVAIGFVTKIYSITEGFPTTEKYGIISQINRAAVSIPINIAEGASRKTAPDFARFLEIAIGSCFELETLLIISTNLQFINSDHSNNLINEIQLLQKRISALRSSILK
jgi:four helix bundle protein